MVGLSFDLERERTGDSIPHILFEIVTSDRTFTEPITHLSFSNFRLLRFETFARPEGVTRQALVGFRAQERPIPQELSLGNEARKSVFSRRVGQTRSEDLVLVEVIHISHLSFFIFPLLCWSVVVFLSP